MILAQTQLSTNNDKWSYCWNSTSFSAAKLYKVLMQGHPAHPIFRKIWNSTVILRYNIFGWLLLHHRLNTRDLSQRKSFHLPSYTCQLCNKQILATTLHLFWDCPFALQCWDMTIPNKKGTLLWFMRSPWLWVFFLSVLLLTLLSWVAGILGYKGITEFSKISPQALLPGRFCSRKTYPFWITGLKANSFKLIRTEFYYIYSYWSKFFFFGRKLIKVFSFSFFTTHVP